MKKKYLFSFVIMTAMVIVTLAGCASLVDILFNTGSQSGTQNLSGAQPRLANGDAYLRRAATHDENGRYDLAIEDINEALRLGFNSTEPWMVYYGRGLVYGKKGDYDSEIKDYNEAIRLGPNVANLRGDLALYVADIFGDRARAYREKGDYDSAIKDYNEAIRLAPNVATFWNSRAWIYAYYMKTNFDQALADVNQALRFAPNNASYLDTRGWVYLGMGDYEKARADFNRALQINPNMSSSREGLSIIR